MPSRIPRRRPTTAPVLALAGIVALAPIVAHAEGLDVTLTDSGVTVGQATSGGQVVLLSVERRPVDFASRLETLVRSTADEDGDGQVTFALEAAAAEASIWLAVDAATGEFGLASPIEGAPFAFPEPLGLATAGSGGNAVGADGHTSLHVLLARPGAGIWKLLAVDGGASEDTGVADGRVLLLAPQWESVAGAPESPGDLTATDRLFAVDAAALSIDAQLYGGLDALP